MNLESYIGKSKADTWIWSVIIILSLGSLLVIYSSTSSLAYRQRAGNTEFYLFKQFMNLVLGLSVMVGAHLLNYKWYGKLSRTLLFLCIPLLLYTFFWGADINEAKRWIQLPVVGLTIQSSDVAKLCLIVYLAYALSSKKLKKLDLKGFFLKIGGPVLFICGLIAPADLSTSILLLMTCLVLMFVGQVSMKRIGQTLGVCMVAFVLYLGGNLLLGGASRLATWKSRVIAYSSDEVGHQEKQAKIAIAKGGLTGLGPGQSTQKNFLPHPYSDFIYAIIIEEYGMITGGLVLLLYLILFYRSIVIFKKSPGAFGALLAFGLMMMLVFQAFINMLVTVGLLPVTGIPLPLVSMGGTSVLFTCLALGIVLSVSRFIETNQGAGKKKRKKKKYGLA